MSLKVLYPIIRSPRWAIFIVTAVALLFRLWGINHALPFMSHPDEPDYIAISQQIFHTGDLNPHFFNYPSLFFYVNSLAYLPYYAVGKWIGVFESTADIGPPITLIMGVTKTPLASTVLLGRSISVLLGAASVLLVFATARRMTGQVWVGLLAGLMMATSQPNVLNNRLVGPDTYLTFFILLVLFFSDRIYQNGLLRDYLWAGLCLGLAVSSKYNGAVVAIVPLIAHLMRCVETSRRLARPDKIQWFRTIFSRKLILLGLISIAIFLLTTPYALLDYAEFITDVRYETEHYSSGHAGMDGNTLRWYLWYLWLTAGVIPILAVMAIVYGVYRRLPNIILTAAFPLIYFIIINRFVVRTDRMVMPLTPFLYLLAALFFYHLWQTVKVIESAKVQKIATIGAAILTIVALGMPTIRMINVQVKATTIDSRITAQAWLHENLSSGSRIVIEAYSVYVEPQEYAVTPIGSIIDQQPDWYVENGFDYVVVGQGMFGRYYREPERFQAQVDAYETIFDRFELTRGFDDGGYEVRIYKVTP